jgi:hypothetical protein
MGAVLQDTNERMHTWNTSVINTKFVIILQVFAIDPTRFSFVTCLLVSFGVFLGRRHQMSHRGYLL